MTQLTCPCLLFVERDDKGISQEVRCGIVFEVLSAWEYGSYCSLYCSKHDLEAVALPDAVPDMQTPDQHFGVNAFRVVLRQQGAFEDREQQLTD